jgi:membrane protease YdiL (CAAX protease family)
MNTANLNQTTEKNSWLKLFIILVFIFGYGVLSVLGGDAELSIDYSNSKMMNLLKIGQVVSVIIVFILPAVLFAQFWTTKKIHYLGVTKIPHITTLAYAAFAMLFAMPLINWLSELNQQMHLPASFHHIEVWMKNSEDKAAKLTEAFMNTTSVKGLLLNLFVVAFMAAVSEEIFFRGIVQNVLGECFKNVHIAVWTGAILFSAFHMQFFGFFPRMIMGAFLGYLYLWSGSLWPSMLAHFVNNGIATLLFWLNKRGIISEGAENIGIGNDQLILVVSSGIVVSGLIYLLYKKEKQRMQLM